MLGVIENRKPITGEFVDIVRESLKRAITGKLNKKELECQERDVEIGKQYNVVWK